MKNLFYALAATSAAVSFAPAYAATVVYGSINPGGVVTLAPAGPGAVSSSLSFDVQGDGAFTATFSFTNPFTSANTGGSAVFNFDPDVLTFTGGNISGGGLVTTVNGPAGSSIQVDRLALAQGPQTLTFTGTLAPASATGGNGFARVGGQLTLTEVAGVVPEPATWALFILGFGAIGGALRRRASQIRVSKATLHFA